MKLHRCRLLFVMLIFCASCTPSSTSSNTNTPQVNSSTEKLDAAIKKNPKDANLFFLRSKMYHGLKKDSLALADLYQAVKLDSTKATYYSAIGDILFEHKDISGSAIWIQKAIERNPDDQLAHLKLAKLFLFIEEYPKAFTEINTVLRSDVYNAEAYFLKGMVYKNMSDTTRAISSFQTAVQTEPFYKDAHMQLAIIYAAKKNALAIKYFENAYLSDSSDLEPLYGQAMFYQDQEKFSEAKKVFKRCILLDKEYEKAYYNTGWMLLQEDSVEKAQRQFSIAIQVKQQYPEAYYNRGLCYEIQQKYDSAKADYEQALLFNPDFEACKISLRRISTLRK